MIFSLFAKSSARSKGILQSCVSRQVGHRSSKRHLPDTLQVHWANLHHVSRLLALQDTITTTTCHTGNVQKLRTIDHVIVLAPSHAHAICLDLEAQAALIFPKSCSDSRFHAMRCDLTSGIE